MNALTYLAVRGIIGEHRKAKRRVRVAVARSRRKVGYFESRRIDRENAVLIAEYEAMKVPLQEYLDFLDSMRP